MRLVCPGCGLTCSVEAWVNDAAVREMLAALAALPQPLPPAVLRYLSLFRPASSAMSWTKALRLVREIVVLTGTGHVQVQGQVSRPCPARVWATAMEQMVGQRETLKRPMKGHNYLRQVAYALADQFDATRERQIEADKQNQHSRPKGEPKRISSPDTHHEEQACSSEVAKENLRKIKKLLSGGEDNAEASE